MRTDAQGSSLLALSPIRPVRLITPESGALREGAKSDGGPKAEGSKPEGRASGSEWRTAPLWGIGLTQTVSGHGELLHDGRARNVTEAILWHGGEAQGARDSFAGMTKEDRDALLEFVGSL